MSVASSSSHTRSPLPKRSRLDSELADDVEVEEEMDEATKAKVARKEARVIRNRESAQRSRNQRKHYLANLEVRNRELEDEVRRLRAESSHPTTSASVTPPRETSPEQTVLSFAGELGIPPQMVSSGVSLSAVAPPPPDADVAPVKQEPISAPASSTTTNTVDVEQLVAQNSALTQRVTMLENLLKQVVAVSNFGGLAPPASAPEPTLPIHQPEPAVVEDDTFDISSFIQSNHTTDAPATTTTHSTQSTQNSSASSFHPVACHSAAVATFVLSSSEDKGKAQQRARGTGTEAQLDSRLITTERLDKGLEPQTDDDETFNNGLGLDLGMPNAQTQAQRTQVETWDEGMNTLLANLEGRVSEEQGLGMSMGQGEVWNTDSWIWGSVPV